ncbi:MAG TPA: hypothetical protein PK052_10140 [Anaerohalosphaeraceae bacterium]|nr:hypothetical protein [Anaerohalosphaeraceae bacterium]HOL32328.1 hypothetical protein [Anaerohalosphaeraceae bacterium]HOM74939.1 hypothetical protein [Anaerohalosphaeraceae bacterium]HPC64926.1 hypothetical protein [Anaerohalosphaeraceae bacterium]HPO68742.1 hypothetical protein [Anaerohalosphaeraceae bacterium]
MSKAFFLLLILTVCVCSLADAPNQAEPKPNILPARGPADPNILQWISASAMKIVELTPAADIGRPMFHLLPLKTDLTNEASLPIYLQVFTEDPNQPEKNPDFELIEQQISLPAEQLDIKAVATELERCRDRLQLLQKASICRNIEWPALDSHSPINSYPVSAVHPDESALFTLTPKEYLDFLMDIYRYGRLTALKARYHIVRREYNSAAEWLQSGLSISRQMVCRSNPQLAMMAAANAAAMLTQIELWIQTPGAPSLYRSLQDLPMPFLVADSTDAPDRKKTEQFNPMMEMLSDGTAAIPDVNEIRTQQETLPVYTSRQAEQMCQQIDRFIAVLECIEGLRYYASVYDGLLPNSLGEITEIRLPCDPVTKRPLIYYRQEDAYILQTADVLREPMPSAFRYKIRLMSHAKE